MPSREEAVQARLRQFAVPATAGSINEDWHAYLNYKSVAAGQLAERRRAFYVSLFPGEATTATAAVAENYFLANPTAIVI